MGIKTKSFLIGIAITASLLGSAVFVDHFGQRELAQMLFWQNGLLQHLAPCFEIGTPEQPFCEGTPLNFIAFIASIPLGVLIYSTIAFVWFRFRARKP